ncbi:unnamed protein product, partial [Brassica oleracea]
MNVGAKPSHRSLSSLSSLFNSRIQKNVHRNTVLIQSELEVEVRRECKTGHLKLEKALLYFEKLVETRPMPLVDTFNHLLGSVMKLKGASEVISMHKRMKHHGSIELNVVTYNIMISGYCKYGKLEEAFKLLREMNCKGLKADSYTCMSLI